MNLSPVQTSRFRKLVQTKAITSDVQASTWKSLMSVSHPELPFSWHREADQHPHPLEEVEHISLLIPL
jgi:hypothetical protein